MLVIYALLLSATLAHAHTHSLSLSDQGLLVIGCLMVHARYQDNFQVRMQREKELLAKVAAKKAARGK